MEELRRLRKQRGLTQAKLAVQAGLDPSSLSQIETGARHPTTRTLEKLARVLDVDVADLFPKGQAPLPLEEASQRPAAATELPGLRAARAKRGIGRNELAALAGLTLTEVEDLEEGEPLAEAVPVAHLAEALGVSVTELLFPADQVAAFLSEDAADNERIRLEMGKLDANDLRALMLATPALRKLSEAFRKGQDGRDHEQPRAV